MKLLHIDASILGAGSVSRQVSAAIVERLRQLSPGLTVVDRDLAAEPLPHVTLAHLPASHPFSADGPDRPVSDAVLAEFLAADVVVIGAPMYNFTIPSQLKAWIDRLLVPGQTFQYTPEGPQGLAGGKRVIIAISRGGVYGAESPTAGAEHVETYLRLVFGFIGVTNLEIIVAEGIAAGPEPRQAAIDGALKAAALVAA
jgi:FMN-dependent NADH-azoreductase